MARHQAFLFGERIGRQPDDDAMGRQGERRRGALGDTDQQPHLFHLCEDPELRATNGQKGAFAKARQEFRRGTEIGDLVTGDVCDRLSRSDNLKSRPFSFGASDSRVRRHFCGERMGRVDDEVDVLIADVTGETRAAAEAADP